MAYQGRRPGVQGSRGRSCHVVSPSFFGKGAAGKSSAGNVCYTPAPYWESQNRGWLLLLGRSGQQSRARRSGSWQPLAILSRGGISKRKSLSGELVIKLPRLELDSKFLPTILT